MATLTIRNLPDEVRDRLRVRAARNRRSMEAEARELLASAVSPEPAAENLDRRDGLRRAREIVRRHVPAGTSLVDEFLGERRALWGED